MEKTAIRAEIKVRQEHGSDGATPYRNTPNRQTPTGGRPQSASNAWMTEGNSQLERFDGGEQRGTSEDYSIPAHPGPMNRNVGKPPPPKDPKAHREFAIKRLTNNGFKEIAGKLVKQAKLRLDQVMPKKDADRLLDDLDRDRRDLMSYVRTELALKNPKLAGEENEPTPDRHDSSPKSMLRPRSEVICATPTGVYAIDKGDYILFPGGGVDDGEPALVGAIRETIEEADLHVLNIDQKDVVESLWPLDSGNEFWDESEYDGERTYFFSGVYGGDLGTSHDDREDFQAIPFETLISRLEELIDDPDQSWARRNNEVRLSLVEAAQGMPETAFRAKKLAAAKERSNNGWGRYKDSLRKVFSPKDPDAFIAAVMAIEEEMGHHCDEVRRFPNDSILIVLRTSGGRAPVTMRDHHLARRISGAVKTAAEEEIESAITFTAGIYAPAASAPGLLVDLDDTIVESSFDNDTGEMREQKPIPGVKEVLELYDSMGVRIIGITNRFTQEEGCTNDDIMAYNQKTMGLFPELSDVVWCAAGPDCDERKPAPDMIEAARRFYSLDPVLAFVGDSEDDEGAASASGTIYFTPEEFFQNPDVYRAVLQTVSGEAARPEMKIADVASLIPRQEYIYLDDEGKVLVRPGENKRFDFPLAGRGKRAPYSMPLRVVPEGGVQDPGYHGYEYQFNLGSGDAPPDFDGQWMPAEVVLKQMYGSMGLSKNKAHRALDRARARVIHRAMKRVRRPAPSPDATPGIPQSTMRQYAMEGDRIAEASRPEDPETPDQVPGAVSGEDWRDKQRALISGGMQYV